jgi:hypothetical protein
MRIAGPGIASAAATILLIASAVPARAEDLIRLKSGVVVRGRIVVETDAAVTIELEPTVKVSYSRGQIATIVRGPAPVPDDAPKVPDPAKAEAGAVAGGAPAGVPQGPMNDLVVRVGPGGVPRRLPPVGLMPSRDFEFYLRRVAASQRKPMAQLSAEERQQALDLAIRDELLFQGALADGTLKDDYCRWYVTSIYKSARTRTPVDPQAATEADLLAYYQAHPEEFRMPVRVRLEVVELPADATDDERQRALAETRATPGAKRWNDAGWVEAGRQEPSEEFETGALRLKVGEMDLLQSATGMHLYRCSQREESGLQPFDAGKVRFALLNAKVRANEAVLEAEVGGDTGPGNVSEALLRKALEAGAAREAQCFLRIINTWLDKKGLRSGPENASPALLAELKRRFPVTVLVAQ